MTPSPVEKAQVSGLPRHVVGVAGVVVDEAGRALAVRRRTPARWELPGGALEHDERVVDGLVREVHEESGLEVEPVALSGVYQNMALGPVALVFLCSRIGGTEGTSDETSEWRWLRPDEIDGLMPPAWAVRFTDALGVWTALRAGRTPGPPPVRAHDGTNLI